MGTSGPGNITHIDNLYVKTFNVQEDVNIVLGQFVVIEAAGARPLVGGDAAAPGKFVPLDTKNIVQAAEDANNLDTTTASLRKNQIECITKGSDWVVVMSADVLPDSLVGITRIASTDVFEVSDLSSTTPAPVSANEALGIYKHKEFSTVATPSVLNDNGIISTGRHI